MNYKMASLSLCLVGISNLAWAGPPPECLEARDIFKKRPLINEVFSCRKEKKVLRDAERFCSDTNHYPENGSGFGVWNPYCHISCDSYPIPLGTYPSSPKEKEFEGVVAHANLCDAELALIGCKVTEQVLYESLQEYINNACCTDAGDWWPCDRPIPK